MIANVATLEEIGAAIEAARENAGLSDKDTADAAGINVTTLYRWKIGQSEPGARVLAMAALRMGKTPNDFLLRDVEIHDVAEDVFNDDDRADLSRMIKSFKALKKLNPDAVSPVKIFAEYVASTERIVIEHIQNGGGIPQGTMIEKNGNVKIYTPQKTTSFKDSIAAGGASESVPRYGKKKAK